MEIISTNLPALERAILNELMASDIDRVEIVDILDRFREKQEFDVQTCIYKILLIVNSKTVERCSKLFASLFADLTSERSKLIAKESVGKMGLSKLNTALVYGEIEFLSFANILEKINPKEGSIFVDLGHGTGKALICAALLFGNRFSRIHGVELLEDLYIHSVDRIAEYKRSISEGVDAHIFSEAHSHCEISVCQGDMLLQEAMAGSYLDWAEADVVFANSTCFDEQLMQAVSEQAARRLKPGARFITLTRPLTNSGTGTGTDMSTAGDAEQLPFRLVDKCQYAMSWGTATCFFHVRV